MRYILSLVAFAFMSASALAECVDPDYQQVPGSRMASAAVLPLVVAVTVLTIPVGIIGAATGEETLAASTSDALCFTGDLAEHTVVGNK
jgi:hypothetical protein